MKATERHSLPSDLHDWLAEDSIVTGCQGDPAAGGQQQSLGLEDKRTIDLDAADLKTQDHSCKSPQ